MLKRLILAGFALGLMGVTAPVEYSIEAIRYGVSPDIPVEIGRASCRERV